MIGELETRTRTFRNPRGCERRLLPSEVKEPFVFYGFQRERATGVEPTTSSLGIRLTKSRKTMIRGRNR
jgi:hypothetical protein